MTEVIERQESSAVHLLAWDNPLASEPLSISGYEALDLNLDPAPAAVVGQREVDDGVKAAEQRRVQVRLAVGGADHDAALGAVEAVQLAQQHAQQLPRRLVHVAASETHSFAGSNFWHAHNMCRMLLPELQMAHESLVRSSALCHAVSPPRFQLLSGHT